LRAMVSRMSFSMGFFLLDGVFWGNRRLITEVDGQRVTPSKHGG
jgi:hypothetical protein